MRGPRNTEAAFVTSASMHFMWGWKFCPIGRRVGGPSRCGVTVTITLEMRGTRVPADHFGPWLAQGLPGAFLDEVGPRFLNFTRFVNPSPCEACVATFT